MTVEHILLTVDVGSEADFVRVTRLREKLNVSRWTDANAEIVRCEPSNDVANIRPKESANMSSLTTLKRGNYVRQMHLFLDIEEARRNELFAEYVLDILLFFRLMPLLFFRHGIMEIGLKDFPQCVAVVEQLKAWRVLQEA